MKMVPIVYRQIYSSRSYCDDENTQGFTPCRDGDKNINAIIVELEPGEWKRGYCLTVRIFEETSFPNFTRNNILVHTLVLWDHNLHDGPKLSLQQAALLGALYRGDIRGKYGQDIVLGLFIDLCILDLKSSVRKYLPELVSFYEGLPKG